MSTTIDTGGNSGSAKLVLEHVGKTFTVAKGETIAAVQDVSFSVASNEFCVLRSYDGSG